VEVLAHDDHPGGRDRLSPRPERRVGRRTAVDLASPSTRSRTAATSYATALAW
jgi:hypothetical protein